MPNWCEGSLRMRGKFENLKNFFKNGLMVYKMNFDDNGVSYVEFPERLSVIDDNDECFYMTIGDTAHITGTKRAFVPKNNIEFYADKNSNCSYAVMVKQAWDFHVEEFFDIAKKYNLDIRLNGFERGREFSREIIIENGTIIKNEMKQYKDYDYECIMPMLGG